ncbi:unnamed protein product [Mytilus coruscus]|uniref:G-protein coupled receptors family 1 profile domain-containing protein n=1 Tax=Mytilus coruscus TaxID=42192 RepID=A0A6J8D286_MYTCO|nr:unnamed protein product [Mytilus coruscus]
MQALAVADFLTAFSSYGLQPLFNSQYACVGPFGNYYRINSCSLPLPYCSIAHHLSIASFTFHTVSYTITTCLGIQKVIAIRFPIWTRNQLTNKKSVYCCVGCFLFSITISFPRHFVIAFSRSSRKNCMFYPNFKAPVEYASVYYLMIQTVLVTCCCLLMLLCTVFILYKLLTNKFRGRMTEQRKQERRSVIMVIIVLVVFLVTEIPKVCLYIWWCYNNISGNIRKRRTSGMTNIRISYQYEQEMARLLAANTDMFSWDIVSRLINFIYLMEGIKLFTIVGCLSNFIIYIIMSIKMRNEIRLIFKKRTNNGTTDKYTTQTQILRHRRTNEIDMNLIQETGNRRTNEIVMNLIQETGIRPSNETEMNVIQETGNRRTNEIDMNLIQETGNRRTNEIVMNLIQETGICRSNETEMNVIQETGNRRTNEIEMNLIQETGKYRTGEIEINLIQETGNRHTNEIEISARQETGNRCTNEIYTNFIQETGNCCTNEIDINSTQETGNSCTNEIEMNKIQDTGNSPTNYIDMNLIQKTGSHSTNEINMEQVHGTGNCPKFEREMNPTGGEN